MDYTVREIKDGTGWSRDARFVDREDYQLVLEYLAHVLEVHDNMRREAGLEQDWSDDGFTKDARALLARIEATR